MRLRTRLLLLSLTTMLLVVVAMTALQVNALISILAGQSIERSDAAAEQVRSLVLQRIAEATARAVPPPATIDAAKALWTRALREDAELPLLLRQILVQSHSIVEIGVADAGGTILASSNPASVLSPLRPRTSLQALRATSALDRWRAIRSRVSDFETRVTMGVPGTDEPVFQVQILVSPVLLRTTIDPELRRAGAALVLALALASVLAYVSAQVAFKPLLRIEGVLDRMIHDGKFEAPAVESSELRGVESKLSLLGTQMSAARRDASVLRDAMSSIARGVAHEIKNPLNAIILRLELLRARLDGNPPEAEADIDLVSQEVRRLDRVVKTFLDLSRTVAIELKPVNLGKLAGDVVSLLGPEAAQSGIRVRAGFPTLAVIAPADEDLLRQALLNVVKNAIQAMPDGGTLSVSLYREQAECVFAVGDTGAGIPDESRAKVFEPYFSTKEQGTGIGLALTMRAMRLHGGTVEVESVTGQGTTFRLRLPAEPVPAREKLA